MALWRRKVPLRAAWAACCLLGTLLILELTHALVPAWSQSHSVITGSERITRLMQDGQVGVVCYGGEWGSIPFYAGRDDNFFNFSDKSPAELLAFLSQYSRYLIVVRQPADIERFRASIPAGMAMIHLADAGQMRVVLVQAVVP